jgi:hypothetical protein
VLTVHLFDSIPNPQNIPSPIVALCTYATKIQLETLTLQEKYDNITTHQIAT